MNISLRTAIKHNVVINKSPIGYIGDNDQFDAKIYLNGDGKHFQLVSNGVQLLYGDIDNYTYSTDQKAVISTRYLNSLSEVVIKRILVTRHLCVTYKFVDGSSKDCPWCN